MKLGQGRGGAGLCNHVRAYASGRKDMYPSFSRSRKLLQKLKPVQAAILLS